MRALVSLTILLAACDPAQNFRLSVVPIASEPPAVTRVSVDSVLQAVAKTHEFREVPRVAPCVATTLQASYNMAERPGWYHNVIATLCVIRSDSVKTTILLSEYTTARWGAKSDSVRRDLLAAFPTVFGHSRVRRD